MKKLLKRIINQTRVAARTSKNIIIEKMKICQMQIKRRGIETQRNLGCV